MALIATARWRVFIPDLPRQSRWRTAEIARVSTAALAVDPQTSP